MNKTGDMLFQLFQHYRTENVHEGIKLYDVFTILYLIDADLFNVFDANVQIELQGILTKGATVVDFDPIEPNCQVVHSPISKHYQQAFYKHLLTVNKLIQNAHVVCLIDNMCVYIFIIQLISLEFQEHYIAFSDEAYHRIHVSFYSH